MIPDKSEFELVDLSTTDKALEDIILCEYPHPLLPENIFKDYSDPDQRVFHFRNLRSKELIDFIRSYKTLYEFEIRDSSTGDFLIVNTVRAQFN